MQDYPQKDFYRLSEVCRYTDTQPYVLRHWQSEFPQLKPSSVSGQPMYRKRDIELIKRIKELLYDEEYTLAAARKKLASEKGRRPSSKAGPRRAARRASVAENRPPARRQERETAEAAASRSVDGVSRQRYQDAVDEIEHLRLAVKEAELDRQRAEEEARELRSRMESVRSRLEQLEQILARNAPA